MNKHKNYLTDKQTNKQTNKQIKKGMTQEGETTK